ncbi:MAG TPA: cysteine hydrolase [Candidatus Acidoferrales bacterium]|nr:cysteine hydrolase [Candidatus Acidoferrales bacterium]
MIRWAGMEILESLDELVSPGHTALLLWDLTGGLATKAFNAKTLAENTKRLLAAARQRGVLTLHARQGSMRWEDQGPAMVRMRMKQYRTRNLAAWRRDGARAGWMRGLKPRSGEIVFEKAFPNAFLGTNFEWWLLRHAIKTIVLAGVSLETGIDGTARTAVDRGFYAVIVKDCVGSRFKDTYEAALGSLERIFDVCSSADIIKAWRKETDHGRAQNRRK